MNELFSIKEQTIIITGGYGVLGSNIARYLASQGAISIILGRNEEKGLSLVSAIEADGYKSAFIQADVLDAASLAASYEEIIARFGRIDALINVAGGNIPGATVAPDKTIFDITPENWNKVVDLNLNGAVYPSLVFGKAMAAQGKGNIINISSMAAYAALTRVPGYAASKAGISNFTQWMATEMALKFGDGVRVNAIAPGFFIGDQNRAILINPDGSLTDRSQKIIAKTPMGRFGDITELNGAVQFLCSEAARFITGVVLPVDGGFLAYSGV